MNKLAAAVLSILLTGCDPYCTFSYDQIPNVFDLEV